MSFKQFSLEAEQAVLCCLLFNSSSWLIVSTKLCGRFFFIVQHKLIFNILKLLKDDGKEIDLIAVFENLKENNYKGCIEIVFYLSKLVRYSVNLFNINVYVSIIYEKYILRCLQLAGEYILNLAIQKNNGTLFELLLEAEKKIFSLSSSFIIDFKSSPRIISKIIPSVLGNFQYNSRQLLNSTVFYFGFCELDKLTNGLHSSDVFIIAGRPSVGKTSFVINIVENIIFKYQTNVSILFFSMEMSAEQLLLRILSFETGIPLQRIKSSLLQKSDINLLKNDIIKISNKCFFIDDSSILTPNGVRLKIQDIIKKEVKLNIIIIDYLQLMSADSFFSNRVAEISEISRSLKILAKEFSISIILLSQLNRNSELRFDKKPLLCDLRDSGAIEQDADVILFINKNVVLSRKYLKEKVVDLQIVDVSIVKHRNGPIGIFNLLFYQECLKFLNLFLVK